MNKIVFSPAKINLFLFIGNKRTDGLHAIESLMVPLKDVGDRLIFSKQTRQGIHVELKLSHKIQRPEMSKHLPQARDNLVWKAADLFFKTTRLNPKIKIQIFKEIPLGSGLGGGSSNSASTLYALNQIYGNPLSIEKLMILASRLGSDVPFFLLKKPALIWGKGDHFKIVSWRLKGTILLLNPGFTIQTPFAYQQWDRGGFSLTKKRQNVKTKSFFSNSRNWKNDFESVIFPKFPELKKAKDILVESGAQYASLSGSGPSIYGVFANLGKAQAAARKFDRSQWIKWMT